MDMHGDENSDFDDEVIINVPADMQAGVWANWAAINEIDHATREHWLRDLAPIRPSAVDPSTMPATYARRTIHACRVGRGTSAQRSSGTKVVRHEDRVVDDAGDRGHTRRSP